MYGVAIGLGNRPRDHRGYSKSNRKPVRFFENAAKEDRLFLIVVPQTNFA
jgi:hypothetical protein